MDDTEGGPPHFSISPMATVELIDTNPALAGNPAGNVLFAGLVTTPSLYLLSPTLYEWHLQCVDYTYYAETSITYGSFANGSMGSIISTETTIANCGITAKPVSEGGYVEDGPIIPLLNVNYTVLKKAWQTISNLADPSTIWGWYVDGSKQLHFYSLFNATSSGVTVTDTPTSQSIYECHMLLDGQMFYEWDGSSLKTQTIVTGSTTSKKWTQREPPVEQWIADGYRTSWPLSFSLPPNANVAVEINGKRKSARVVQNFQAVVTSDFLFMLADNVVWSLQVNPNALNPQTPKAGSRVAVYYDYINPVIAVANDFQSQAIYDGPNHGIFSDLIRDSQLGTVQLAMMRAQGNIQEFGSIQEHLNFTASEDWEGWFRAGMTFQLKSSLLPDSQNNYAPGLTATYVISSLRMTIENNGYRQCQVDAIRIG
jgi:hypothetical protein